jgi:flagellar basal body-associated protein FliL
MKEENIPATLPEVIKEELDGREKRKKLREIVIKVFGSLFIIIVALVLAIFYLNQLNRNKQAELEKQKEREKEAQQLEQSNSEYIKTMNAICSKPVAEITALDFFKCKAIKDDYLYIDLKLELENPELTSFCQRKIQELNANEFIDCLEEKESP